MRLVFQQFPWVHAPAPRAFKPLFLKFGRRERLLPGQAIYNGGVDAEVAYILSGLCTYRMQDARDREHYLTLVAEGRLAGNVDGFTGDVVNVLDYALRRPKCSSSAGAPFSTCSPRIPCSSANTCR